MYKKNLVFSFFSLILVGCTQETVDIKMKLYSSYSNDSFCVADPIEVQGNATKLLFVIDMSGSNGTTDSTGSKRADNIDRFVQKLSSRGESYQYGILLGSGSPLTTTITQLPGKHALQKIYRRFIRQPND